MYKNETRNNYTASNLTYFDLIDIYFALETVAQEYENNAIDCYKRIAEATNNNYKNTERKLVDYYHKREKEIRSIQRKIKKGK